MSKPPGFIIEDMGMLYRISKKNWIKWLRAQAEGEDLSLEQAGGKFFDIVAYHISDMDAREAQFKIKQLEESQ